VRPRTKSCYNERGWATQIVDPLGGTITRRYDPAGASSSASTSSGAARR
jgi:uncharacterized protein RhaS with RHS repeats